MFLCCTSQGVDIVVKWLFSLVVTSNHKCLNKIVSNKLALIIFEPRTRPQRWYITFFKLHGLPLKVKQMELTIYQLMNKILQVVTIIDPCTLLYQISFFHFFHFSLSSTGAMLRTFPSGWFLYFHWQFYHAGLSFHTIYNLEKCILYHNWLLSNP